MIRVEAPLKPPATYKKDGVGHVTPDGFETGRDHRGHNAPERGAPNKDLVNQPENVIAEHGTKSNLSKKKAWENDSISKAQEEPDSKWSTIHEPKYDGDNTRPSSVDHTLVKNGKPQKTTPIDNPTE